MFQPGEFIALITFSYINNKLIFVCSVNWEEDLRHGNFHNQSDIARNQSTQFESSIYERIEMGNESIPIVDDMDNIWKERHEYIKYYSLSMLIVLYLVFQRSFAFFQMCLKASRNLHDKLFRGITRATMYFYNTNPSGRILNRFSKDIGSIDTTLPVALMDCLLVS